MNNFIRNILQHDNYNDLIEENYEEYDEQDTN
jgi:hypothetical protein